MKLADRLEAHADDLPVCCHLDRQTVALLREAAAELRRVEDSVMVERNHRAGVVCPHMYGQRVRLVPEPTHDEARQDEQVSSV